MGIWHLTKQFFGFVEDEDVQDETHLTSALGQTDPLSNKQIKSPAADKKSVHPFPSSEIKIEEPRIYEDSLNISSHLRENKPCIVNLKHLDSESGKRLIDFICGTAYAINGHMMKIGDNIFLFTPANIQIVETKEQSPFEQGVQEAAKAAFITSQDTPQKEAPSFSSTYSVHQPKTTAERLAERRAAHREKEASRNRPSSTALPLP
ncbi:MAG: cell division protein SepF [Candidatus Margulisbacteria bacterium]|nr:cell division protein SepF [Candidatus Margulisiibacteriota bacterium]